MGSTSGIGDCAFVHRFHRRETKRTIAPINSIPANTLPTLIPAIAPRLRRAEPPGSVGDVAVAILRKEVEVEDFVVIDGVSIEAAVLIWPLCCGNTNGPYARRK